MEEFFAIIFSIWHLLHSIFFLDTYNKYNLPAILYASKDEGEEIRTVFEYLNNTIYGILFCMLLLVLILLLICHKKNGIKVFKKNDVKTKLPIATSCILAGTILSFAIGFTGLGLHTVINDLLILIGGICLIIA